MGADVRSLLEQHRGGVIIIAVASALLNLIVFAGSLYMLLVYDSVLPSHSVSTLLGLFAMLAALYIFQAVFDQIRSRTLLSVANAVHTALSPQVHYAAVHRPLRAAPGDGDGMQPVRDLDQVHTFLSGGGPAAFMDLPWVVVFILVLFGLHFWLGLTALAGVLVLAGLTWWTSKATQRETQDFVRVSSQRNAAAGAAIRYGEAIVAMGMQRPVLEQSGRWNREFLVAQSRLALIVAQLGGAGRIFRIFLQSLILTVGALLVIDGKASGGVILAASVLSGRALAPVDQAIANWRSFASARTGWERLKNLLAAVPIPAASTVVLPPPSRDLSVKDVWVAPPGSSRFTLAAVTFALQPGEALGVIGPSAAGKTTLVRALLGIWSAGRGSIRLDGATHDQWDRDRLGKSFGYVAQQVELFEGTIGENIARFEQGAQSDAVIAAARAAGMHELIVGLEAGYETPLSNGGNELSAGQRQRLGLARALYGDPFLVVLDEPNSNLDAEGDAALAQAILDVRKRGGVVVMVTHRPAALAPTTHVLLLRAGQMETFGERDKVLEQINPRREADQAKGAKAGASAPKGTV